MQKFQENVALARYSNYRIGGPARFFFAPKNEKEVRWAVKTAKAKRLPVFMLGGGTNLLIDDKGFNGLVLQPNIRTLSARGTRVDGRCRRSHAEPFAIFREESLSGLEWAGGLPGTVGGAIRGNAGCFGGEIKDAIVSVRSFDMKTMKIDRAAGGKMCDSVIVTSVFKSNEEAAGR